MKRGFTLIELLVAIGIIGLLAAVILVALNSAKAKAVIGSSIQFENNMYQTMGDRETLQWDFNDCSGTPKDSTNNGNNGAFGGTAPTWQTDTPLGSGCSLLFSGSNNVHAASSAVANFNSQPFTISAWIKPTTLAQNADGNTIVSNANFLFGGYFLAISTICNSSGNGDVCFEINKSGSTATIQSSNGAVAVNTWSQIVATFDGNAMTLYVNGKRVATGSTGWQIGATDQTLTIGQATQGGWGSYTGYIDDVRVYQQAISQSNAERLYAQESFTHDIAER